MKISELIEELEEAKEEHGDREVLIDRSSAGDEIVIEEATIGGDEEIVTLGFGGEYGHGG